ncbi:MAG: hypothetical protein HY912_18965 [Desulfomonile tiedjei]|uniref:Uncharacterized protein n=1 Tax=Desulfomonile tiedjei TaxID=2358 RepID=A0A9D6Z5J2_9BACT|nr:hypothetical protein [Desulfomonile tiedjei]
MRDKVGDFTIIYHSVLDPPPGNQPPKNLVDHDLELNEESTGSLFPDGLSISAPCLFLIPETLFTINGYFHTTNCLDPLNRSWYFPTTRK